MPADPIVDKREAGEAMTGWPVTRATGGDGRWVYTLYSRVKGSQNALWHVRMSLSRDGSTIFLRDKRHSVAVPVPGAA